jgi:hypothetical protein
VDVNMGRGVVVWVDDKAQPAETQDRWHGLILPRFQENPSGRD